MAKDKEIGEAVVEVIASRLPKGAFPAFNEVLLINSFISFALDRLGLLSVKIAENPEESKELAFWNLMEFVLGLAQDQSKACAKLSNLLEEIVTKNVEFEKVAEEARKVPGGSKLIH